VGILSKAVINIRYIWKTAAVELKPSSPQNL